MSSVRKEPTLEIWPPEMPGIPPSLIHAFGFSATHSCCLGKHRLPWEGHRVSCYQLRAVAHQQSDRKTIESSIGELPECLEPQRRGGFEAQLCKPHDEVCYSQHANALQRQLALELFPCIVNHQRIQRDRAHTEPASCPTCNRLSKVRSPFLR